MAEDKEKLPVIESPIQEVQDGENIDPEDSDVDDEMEEQ